MVEANLASLTVGGIITAIIMIITMIKTWKTKKAADERAATVVFGFMLIVFSILTFTGTVGSLIGWLVAFILMPIALGGFVGGGLIWKSNLEVKCMDLLYQQIVF